MTVAKDLFVDRLNNLIGMAEVSISRCDQCLGVRHCLMKVEGRVLDSPPHPVGRLLNEMQDQCFSYITSVIETILPPRAWMYFIWLDMSLPDTR